MNRMPDKTGPGLSKQLSEICQIAAKIVHARLALLYIVDHNRQELHWVQGLAAGSIPRDHLRIVRRLHIPLNESGGLYFHACAQGKILQASPEELNSTYSELIQRWIPVAGLCLIPIQCKPNQTDFLLVLGIGNASVPAKQPTAAWIKQSLTTPLNSWRPLLTKVQQRWQKRDHNRLPVNKPRQREVWLLSLSIEKMHRLAIQSSRSQWNQLVHKIEYIYEVFLMMANYHCLQRTTDRFIAYAWQDRMEPERFLEHALGLHNQLLKSLQFLNLSGTGALQNTPALNIRMAITTGPVQSLRLGSRLQIWGPCVEGAEMLRRSVKPGNIFCTLGKSRPQTGPFTLLPRGRVKIPGQTDSQPLYILGQPDFKD